MRKQNEWFRIDLTVSSAAVTWIHFLDRKFSIFYFPVMCLLFQFVWLNGWDYKIYILFSIAYNLSCLQMNGMTLCRFLCVMLYFKIFGCKYSKPLKCIWTRYVREMEREREHKVWLLIGLVWHSNFSRFSMSLKLNGFNGFVVFLFYSMSLFCSTGSDIIKLKWK